VPWWYFIVMIALGGLCLFGSIGVIVIIILWVKKRDASRQTYDDDADFPD
jgi:hypothetical protein